MTDFVVAITQKEAKKVIEENDIIKLSIEDQQIFVEALMNPPQPNDALKRAFAHRKRLIQPE